MKIHYTILAFTLLACGEKSEIKNTLPVNFTDTIRRIDIHRLPNGDSLVEQQIITFTPNGLTMPIDSFYYHAQERRYNKGEHYRIYFDRQKVIAYCDSMLKVIGPETLDNYNDISTYSIILKHAQQGFAETIMVSETHYLMNRFRPLIINPETGHKPAYYFTTNRRSSEREDIEREFVTQKGDTFGLSWENIWIAPISIDTTKKTY